MNVKELEKIVLEKLDQGLLDGIVGNDFVTGDYAKAVSYTHLDVYKRQHRVLLRWLSRLRLVSLHLLWEFWDSRLRYVRRWQLWRLVQVQ